jgi:serine protease DegQ
MFKSLALSALLACAIAFALPGPVGAAVPIGTTSVAPVLREVTPAVVNIAVRGRTRVQNPLLNDPFFRRFFNIPDQQPLERQTQATGSGVIVDSVQGYILTANHVVQDATSIEVTLKDNRRFKADLVGRDPETDIAVLKISAPNLIAVPMADSDRTEVGDFVLAIGNPFGLGQTVTSGIVSALGRSGINLEGYEDFIQTDAPINPGNSGGALVDLTGRLIGINTAILAPGGGNIGIGFAVPINMARSVMDQLIRYGQIQRGRIGIAIQDLTPELADSMNVRRTEGALVTNVETRSSAERAGLRSGDIIVAIDGVPVRSSTQLRNRIGLMRVNQDIEMLVERNGRQFVARARVDQIERPEAAQPQARRSPRRQG